MSQNRVFTYDITLSYDQFFENTSNTLIMYFINIFWLKSFFSSMYTGISYFENIAFIKLEYVSRFFVIIPISLYLYPFSLTSSIILLATCSISEYGFAAKNIFMFLFSSSYFLYVFG